jgi:hypothetical protein
MAHVALAARLLGGPAEAVGDWLKAELLVLLLMAIF